MYAKRFIADKALEIDWFEIFLVLDKPSPSLQFSLSLNKGKGYLPF